MENYRKTWMKQQTALRSMLESTPPRTGGVELLLSQHAWLHSQKMAKSEPWSYEDEILDGLSDRQWRQIPPGGEHSIAWMIWHIARIEDTAVNILVAGSLQVFDQENWSERLNTDCRTSGNELDEGSVAAQSERLDLQALREYRLRVGQRTRQIIQGLQPDELKRKVDPARIKQVQESGAIDEHAHFITDYWSKRTIAGLLLMPATRHNFVHLNEAASQAKKIR